MAYPCNPSQFNPELTVFVIRRMPDTIFDQFKQDRFV